MDTPIDLETAAADDRLIPFQVGEGDVRGRIARLGPLVERILNVRSYPEPVAVLLGEAAALTALLGASLKFDGKMTLQAKGDGPVRFLVVDYVSGGDMRGLAHVDAARLAEIEALKGESPAPVQALLGAGHLAITLDQGPDMDRYQGIVCVEGDSLADAARTYFDQSEQVPTAVKLAVGRVYRPGAAPAWRAGGIIVQSMPGDGGDRERGEAMAFSEEQEDLWRRASLLLDTTETDELVDPTLTPEELLYRLYNEDGVRVFDDARVRFGCSCNREKIAAVLARYGRAELEDMAEDGVISVACEFCGKSYAFDPETAAAPSDDERAAAS
ncbi:MAG: Hsp33 family molecular chaperone [Pseudomonadota bacterium]